MQLYSMYIWQDITRVIRCSLLDFQSTKTYNLPPKSKLCVAFGMSYEKNCVAMAVILNLAIQIFLHVWQDGIIRIMIQDMLKYYKHQSNFRCTSKTTFWSNYLFIFVRFVISPSNKCCQTCERSYQSEVQLRVPVLTFHVLIINIIDL